MSFCRQLDMYFGDGTTFSVDVNRDHYVSLEAFIRFCVASGLCSMVASNNGSGAASGQGNIDYHDGANPAGENAWNLSVWDQGAGQPFYILIQWADADTFGAAPGNPGLLRSGSGTDGIGIAMAVRDGGGNPWNGTSNDDGSDTKGATVWTGADVRVFPRSNATGGNDVTNKENMAEFIDFDASSPQGRSHFCADENCLYLVSDDGADNTFLGFVCGHYTPFSGLVAVCTTPYFMAADDTIGGFFGGGPYGDIAGTDGQQGGICAIPASDVIIMSLSSASWGNLATNDERAHLSPNNVRTVMSNDPYQLLLLANESPDFGGAGHLTSRFVEGTYGTQQNHVMTDKDGRLRASIGFEIQGEQSANGSKHAFPWEGAAPETQYTREGRQSFVP
jgi:hypothetical protein